ncbi:MAG: hypothetical protein K2M94_00720 [Paramuribaculum sp.]|nr:hypothetical protein [Paramuribaculum sp.]
MENQDRFEELRKKWQNIEINEPLPAGEGRHRPSYRTLSNLDRLRRLYRVMMVVAILWVPLFPFLLTGFGLPVWLRGCGSIYFAIMAFFLWRVYYELRCIDFATMSVVEVMRSICLVERMRIIHLMVGIVTALPLVGIMLYYFSYINEAVLWGGIVGAVAGVAVGVVNTLRTSRWIKSIKVELASVAE